MKIFFLLLIFAVISAGCSASENTPPESKIVTPTATAPTNDLTDFYTQIVTWEPCKDLSSALCAAIEVPLDYDNPSGPRIDIQLAKLVAKKDKTASLLFNPGGPGASGITYLAYADQVFSKTLLDNFDIVGFDPRGVGTSSPIDCLSDRALDEFLAFDGTPDNEQEIEQLLVLTKQMAQGCEEISESLVANIGTRDAARDMDVIRAILNETQLNFLGVSYGSFLGATYADLFAENVGQFVLDGGVDPQRDSMELSLDQALGLENALDRFLDDCLIKNDCPFEDSKASARIEISNLLLSIDSQPIATNDPARNLTQSMTIYGIAVFLYSEDYWPFLRDAFSAAFEKDGSLFLYINDLFNERNLDGTFKSNVAEAIYAINCFDKPAKETVNDVKIIAEEYKSKAPIFGEYLAWTNLACGYWPAGESEDFNLKAQGSKPILVIGTTNDPATPYLWSQALVEQLDNAWLLTFEGDGHTAYMRGSDCVDDIVDNFFLQEQIPTSNLTCDS